MQSKRNKNYFLFLAKTVRTSKKIGFVFPAKISFVPDMYKVNQSLIF